jgi:hypothetical protein
MTVNFSLAHVATADEVTEWAERAWPGGLPTFGPGMMREIYEAHGAPERRARAEQESEVTALRREVAALRTELRKYKRALPKALGQVLGAKEKRLAALEQRPSIQYRGLYTAGVPYQPGDVITHKGALWHANIASIGDTPGEGANWTLCVKAGRDGRDAPGASGNSTRDHRPHGE